MNVEVNVHKINFGVLSSNNNKGSECGSECTQNIGVFSSNYGISQKIGYTVVTHSPVQISQVLYPTNINRSLLGRTEAITRCPASGQVGNSPMTLHELLAIS